MYSILINGIGHAGASFFGISANQLLLKTKTKDLILDFLEESDLNVKEKTNAIFLSAQITGSAIAMAISALVQRLLKEPAYYIGSRWWGLSGMNLHMMGSQGAGIAYNFAIGPGVRFFTGKILEMAVAKTGVGKDYAEYIERTKSLLFDPDAAPDAAQEAKRDFIEKHEEACYFVMCAADTTAFALTVIATNVAIAYRISV